jgi:septal ring factor EnvC (AmiA/AmiB activator)
MDYTQFIALINSVLFIATCIGAVFTFRNARRTEIMSIQSKTIEALKEQLEAIQTRQKMLEEKNEHLERTIETIQQALKQLGMIITIDGELITITDATGANASYKKRAQKTTLPDAKP